MLLGCFVCLLVAFSGMDFPLVGEKNVFYKLSQQAFRDSSKIPWLCNASSGPETFDQIVWSSQERAFHASLELRARVFLTSPEDFLAINVQMIPSL